MIPKVIHYCWFGGKHLPPLSLKCIESWKKFCPDYEIKEWNEQNFDVNSNIYCQEAYKFKRWAFVSDYVRLKILEEYGGIYMDTDVEVIRPFDPKLLDCKAFSGFENITQVPTGIIAAEANMPIIQYLLKYYNDNHFLKEKDSLDITTNVVTITNMMVKRGLILNNSLQTIENFTFYPNDYFCPKNYSSGKICITDNTYTIHHFGSSWKNSWEVRLHHIKQIIKRFLRTEFLSI